MAACSLPSNWPSSSGIFTRLETHLTRNQPSLGAIVLGKKKVGPGFAILGINTEYEAIQQIHSALVEKKPPRTSFDAGSEVTLVLFLYCLASDGSGIFLRVR